jgi:hypothetical protein
LTKITSRIRISAHIKAAKKSVGETEPRGRRINPSTPPQAPSPFLSSIIFGVDFLIDIIKKCDLIVYFALFKLVFLRILPSLMISLAEIFDFLLVQILLLK